MAVATALSQTQTTVFYQWKMWAQARIHKRRQLKRRTLRNLRIAVQQKKQLQKMALSALGFQV